jgi:hypothetical protein
VKSGAEDRALWVAFAERLARPVLGAFAARRLRSTMPTAGAAEERADFAPLEAIGRLLAGIAPWLDLAEAGDPARDALRALAAEALDAATDPASPDFCNFVRGEQPVVDAAFLAQGLLRGRGLWGVLPDRVRERALAGLRTTRRIKPHFNNWLLFSATIEALLASVGEEWDRMRVDYALRQHMQWYAGDGTYGDGPGLHWDYYNSFVIHPMLVDILRAIPEAQTLWPGMRALVETRARRYAAILERMIAPDGTFPVIGRSIVYRAGAFHLLSQAALLGLLPEGLAPAAVRSGLSAVLRRTLEPAGTFDAEGWLAPGLAGLQPSLAEPYISRGSLYLCSTALVALGLPAASPFWSDPPADWTGRAAWSGSDLPRDHAL